MNGPQDRTPPAGPPYEFLSCSFPGPVTRTAYSGLFLCTCAGFTSAEYLGTGEWLFGSVVVDEDEGTELLMYTAVADTDPAGNPDPLHTTGVPWIGTPTALQRDAPDHLLVGLEIGYNADQFYLDPPAGLHALARIPLDLGMSVFVLGRVVVGRSDEYL